MDHLSTLLFFVEPKIVCQDSMTSHFSPPLHLYTSNRMEGMIHYLLPTRQDGVENRDKVYSYYLLL